MTRTFNAMAGLVAEKAAQQERAAIVAWLRAHSRDQHCTADQAMTDAAESIERGDHLKGGF